MIAIIAAYAHGRVIGCAGKIPWNIPGEQARFRELTTGNVVIMGRRTYEEIGRPLPNRDTILVSSTLSVEQEHCTTVPTLAQALALAGGREVFISGGEQLYREALPLADVLYLTTVEADIPGDRFFPEFDPDDYEITQEKRVDGDIPYIYWTYRRRPMTPDQAQNYLQEIAAARGIVLGLGPIRALLARLGNPQDRTKFIHIAGTNGKGSTGAMLCSVLTQAGYRTGQFSSPAVFDPMEPWRINGQPIPEDTYARLMTRIRAQRDAMLRAGEPVPTAFELETALAFLYFAEQSCDIAVLECGMGGLEDATNVITTTEVSLLTSIGLEHTKFLGNTIAKIARNKAGIIKSGVPAVLQGQDAAVCETVRAVCAQTGSELVITRPEEISLISASGDRTELSYRGQRWKLSLDGSYQMYNAAQVIEAAGYEPEHDLENPADSVFCAHGAGFVVPWDQVRSHMHVDSGWGKAARPEPEAQTVPQRRAMAYRATLEEDAELLKIFERTYGPIKRDPLAAFRPAQKRERPDFDAQQWEILPEYLLVDGYNIIFAWDELNALAKDSLEAARHKLMDILCNYQGYQKCNLILVFDAYRVPGSPGSIEQYHNIHVVYTKEAETADMFIEHVTHEIGKGRRVRVATSDGMEQIIILGHGALRVSARMFHEEVQNVEKQIRALVQGHA